MMKRKFLIFLVLGMLFLGLIALLIVNDYKNNPYKEQQERLASDFGINITDYPYPNVFPEGYYKSVLSQNSTLEEVHKLVTGYNKVYTCGKNIEIYYYFSDSDQEALRFKISYSSDLKYEVLQGEDDDSRYLDPYGCIEGRIAEK